MNKGTHNGGFHHGERHRETIKSRHFESSVDAMEDLFNVNIWRPAFKRFWASRGMEEPTQDKYVLVSE